MATKQLLPNQCNILHPVTGADKCCLCAERAETARLRAECERKDIEIARVEGERDALQCLLEAERAPRAGEGK
jgi:hypothetical protein